MHTTRSSGRIATLLAATAVVSPVAACLDFTPIANVASADGGATQDGAPKDAKASETTASDRCLDCLVPHPDSGGCASAYAACEDVDKCKVMFDCALNRGCFSGSVGEAQTCLVPCAGQAGVSSEYDPAVKPLVALYLCLEERCESACSGGGDR